MIIGILLKIIKVKNQYFCYSCKEEKKSILEIMGGTREEIEESKTQEFNQGNNVIALPALDFLEEECAFDEVAAPIISSSDDTE